jgi:hypothetical protein
MTNPGGPSVSSKLRSKETTQTRTPPLWKRLGRRGSKSGNSNNNPTGPPQIDVNEPPVEHDNGDARSLSAKRAQRQQQMMNGSKRGGLGGSSSGGGRLIRKFKNSFRKSNTSTNSEQREDSEVIGSQGDVHDQPETGTTNNLNSPGAYSVESLVSVEVRSRTYSLGSCYA